MATSEGTLRDAIADGERQRNSVLEEAESPQGSPKRKSLGSFREGGKSEARKTEHKPKATWRSRFVNPFRRKPKRSVESFGDILEATEFSFRQPFSRGSPAILSASHKKRDSPSLDLQRLKKPTHSSLEVYLCRHTYTHTHTL